MQFVTGSDGHMIAVPVQAKQQQHIQWPAHLCQNGLSTARHEPVRLGQQLDMVLQLGCMPAGQ